MAAAFIGLLLRRGPNRPISNSKVAGLFAEGRSPTQMNEPLAALTIASYSRFARMHGGSFSSFLDWLAAGNDDCAAARL